jgi:hypothetical protein
MLYLRLGMTCLIQASSIMCAETMFIFRGLMILLL